MLDGKNCDFNGWSGAYAWIEGYAGSVKCLNLVYSAGKIWYNIGGKDNYLRAVPPVQLALPEEPNKWHEVELNILDDYTAKNEHEPWDTGNIDRIVINLGVWNINDGYPQPFAIYFDDIQTLPGFSGNSHANGKAIEAKSKEAQWWRGKTIPFTHTTGEHRYVLETPLRYPREIDKK
jgi:hypothetical protein